MIELLFLDFLFFNFVSGGGDKTIYILDLLDDLFLMVLFLTFNTEGTKVKSSQFMK